MFRKLTFNLNRKPAFSAIKVSGDKEKIDSLNQCRMDLLDKYQTEAGQDSANHVQPTGKYYSFIFEKPGKPSYNDIFYSTEPITPSIKKQRLDILDEESRIAADVRKNYPDLEVEEDFFEEKEHLLQES